MIETIYTALAVLLRVLSNPLGNVFQKQLTARGNDPLLINFLTYLLLSVPCIVIALPVRWHMLPAAFWWYATLGGIVGAAGNGFLVKALQKGDLSVLGPVNSYKSVVGMVFGFVLLHELPNGWGVLGIALIIYGSYFVLDTTETRFTWALLKKPAIAFRIWAMILTGIEAVLTKKIIQASSTTITFVCWCWFGAAFSFLFLLLARLPATVKIKTPGRQDAGKYLLLVICVGTMQVTTNYAFAHMPVAYALSLFQLSTIISVLLGYRFFKEQDIRKKMLGALIMLTGSVVIIVCKNS